MNGLNIELRPGLRVVKETYGNKEILYIEEDSVIPTHARFIRGLLTFLFLIGIIIGIGTLAYQQATDSAASPEKMENTIGQ